MRNDPILDRIGMLFYRMMLFVALSFVVALILWLWVLVGEFGVAVGDLPIWLREAWTPTVDHKLAAVITRGCVVIGVLSISVLYLLVAKWWKTHANVHHHRGARFDDREV